jgi:glycosyltransferase involved in cell wall biosynthesis
MEAIASGTPVVASDIPPHREFVGDVARLVSSDDDDALADAVRSALQDEPPARTAITDLTIPAAADRFMTHLSSLLH